MTVHPEDILLVASLGERAEHRHWPESQIISLHNLGRANGLKVRHVYVTPMASRSARYPQAVRTFVSMMSGAFKGSAYWEPEENDLLSKIAALPEQQENKSRDFGRGYSLAVKDVLKLITSEAV